MASRRLQKRIEVEAAEKRGTKTAKKKATKKGTTRKKTTTRKRKTKAVERKKIFWGVFSGTLKEEGRFPYDQRDKAEEKLEALRNRSTKKLYFIQPIKTGLSEAATVLEDDVIEEPVEEPIEDQDQSDDDMEMVGDDEDLELDDDDVGDDEEE